MRIKTLLARLHPHLRRNRELEEKIAEKNETLQRVRGQVAKRDKKRAELRTELAQAKAAKQSPSLTSGGMPVFFVVGWARSGTTWHMVKEHLECSSRDTVPGRRAILRA